MKTILIILFVNLIYGLSPELKISEGQKSGSDVPSTASEVITIENLEALLRRASEIFKPSNLQRPDSPIAEVQQVTVPIQFMQPPTNQPYNFYLPLFDYDENNAHRNKPDEKSHNVEIFTLPYVPKEGKKLENFYDVKFKKASPKKFNADSKHINIKWLNTYEKELNSPSDKQLLNIPKNVYLLNDERNRINFDDTFFTVDMKVSDRTNNLDKLQTEVENQNSDYTSQGEEDLTAAASLQIPLISRSTNLRR